MLEAVRLLDAAGLLFGGGRRMAIGRARAGDILRGRKHGGVRAPRPRRGAARTPASPPRAERGRGRGRGLPHSASLAIGASCWREMRRPPVSLGFDLELQNFAVIHRAVALGHVLD